MYTRTRTAPGGAASGRFPRQLARTRRTAPARRTVPTPPVHFGRRPPQKSTTGRALESLMGLLPGSKAKPRRGGSGGRGKGKAGFALLAGAAGLAFKNRDKLTSLLGRKHAQEDVVELSATTAAPEPTGPAVGGEAAAESVPPPAR
jgi:hypothetical protein